MKSLICSLVLLTSVLISKAQYPIITPFGSPVSQTTVSPNGGVKAVFIPTSFADTTAANAVPYVKTVPFAIISCTTPNALYFRNANATAWVQILPAGGSGGQNGWLVGGNSGFFVSPTDPQYVGTKTNQGFGFLTNNSARLTIPSTGIQRTSNAAYKYLLMDTSGSVHLMGYGDAGSSVPISSLTAAAAGNAINNGAFTQDWQWNGLTSNIGLSLSSGSSAATGNAQTTLSVQNVGANGNASQTTFAGVFINGKTGTSSTNIALDAYSTGGTTNIAGRFKRGSVNIGTVGVETGTVIMAGSTAGTLTLKPDANTASYTWTYPSTGGTSGYVLTTNGSGTTTFTDPATIVTATPTLQQVITKSGVLTGNNTIGGTGNLTINGDILTGKNSTYTSGLISTEVADGEVYLGDFAGEGNHNYIYIDDANAMQIYINGPVTHTGGAFETTQLIANSNSNQLYIGYNSLNYYTTSVNSVGMVTFDAFTGTSGAGFTFADTITASSLTASQLVQTNSSKKLISSTALPNGTTATTQSAGDNSTKVATTAYVATAVAGSISGLTTNYVTKATSSTTIGNSQIYDDGTYVGVGITSPNSIFNINGDGTFAGSGVFLSKTGFAHGLTSKVATNVAIAQGFYDANGGLYSLGIRKTADQAAYIFDGGYNQTTTSTTIPAMLFNVFKRASSPTTNTAALASTEMAFMFSNFTASTPLLKILGNGNTTITGTATASDFIGTVGATTPNTGAFTTAVVGYTTASGSPTLEVNRNASGFAQQILQNSSSGDGLYIRQAGTSTSHYALDVETNGGGTGALYVRADGNVGIGTTSPGSTLTVNGLINMKGYTVAALPAGAIGDIAYVTDALAPTFLAIVVGGGTVKSPVFFNGTNWVGF